MRKYVDEITQMFPGETYSFGIMGEWERFIIHVRVRDYAITLPIDMDEATQEEIDREFTLVLEVIKDRLDHVRSQRKLP